MVERIRYKCSNCNYAFTRKSDAEVTKCPYCAKPDTVRQDKGDFASSVLDEVSSYQ